MPLVFPPLNVTPLEFCHSIWSWQTRIELHHPAESGVSKASAFYFISRTVCSSYPTLNLRRLSFSSRRKMDLEQSSTAYHICSVTSCVLLWLKDLLLQTLLTCNYCCARELTLSFMDTLIALTYLLTYLPAWETRGKSNLTKSASRGGPFSPQGVEICTIEFLG